MEFGLDIGAQDLHKNDSLVLVEQQNLEVSRALHTADAVGAVF